MYSINSLYGYSDRNFPITKGMILYVQYLLDTNIKGLFLSSVTTGLDLNKKSH